ncbi:MAG: hypothetical protein J7L82_03875 [Staphylothermus sp.]|nr:hypothetical protein [Staphylothermus sp.]
MFEQGLLKDSTVHKYVWNTVRALESLGVVRVVRRNSNALVLLNNDADLDGISEYFSIDLPEDVFRDRLNSAVDAFYEALLKEIGVFYGSDSSDRRGSYAPGEIVGLTKALKKYARETGKRAYRAVITFNRAIIGVPRLRGVWTREFSISNKFHLHGAFVYDIVDKYTAKEYLIDQIVKWLDKRLEKVPDPEVKEYIRREYISGVYINVEPLRGSGRSWGLYMVKGVSSHSKLDKKEQLYNIAMLWIKQIKWCSVRVNSRLVKAYAEIDFDEFL